MDANKVKMYGGGGLSEHAEAQPLRAEERHGVHRMLSDTPCHDCGQKIMGGEMYCSSTLTVREGTKARSWTYAIHTGCYEVLKQLMPAAQITARSLFASGRPPMWEIYKSKRAEIDQANPPLGAMLAHVFKEKLK